MVQRWVDQDQLLDTFLSQPVEWASLGVGLLGALLIIWVTETRLGALLGVTFFILGLAVFLPLQILTEWHYWGGMLLLMLTLGAYRYGPSS